MLLYTTINNKNTITSKYLNEDIINLLDSTFIIPADFSFNVFDVTNEYIARPDLISLDAYGDTTYADVICKLNGISNPFELNEGMKIILPTSDVIMDFVTKQSQQETNNDDTDNTTQTVSTPVAKNPSSNKRKANEAIIGDSRFKIDETNGVIIY